MGLGLLAPKISLPNIYPPYRVVGPAWSASLPLLAVWMDVVYLIRSCQTSTQLDFWVMVVLYFSCNFDVVV